MRSKIIRVGIAGFGMSGTIFHAPFLHAHPAFELKKVYERKTNRAETEYPYVQTVRSFEELLTDDIDLVIISLPNLLHVPAARQAILAGKNVIIEKPMAATAAEAEELVRLAEQQGVLLTVYQNRRLDGDFLTVKKLIEDGSLGEIVDYRVRYDRYVTGLSSKQWKNEGGPGVNILYDLGVHIVDQIYHLFGMPETVSGEFRKLREESGEFDAFDLVLRYGELRASASATETAPAPGPHYTVNGRKGSFIKFGMDVQEEALLAGARPPMEHWGEDDPAMYGTWTRITEQGPVSEKVETCRGWYGTFYDRLYDALVNGAPAPVDPMDAVNVLRILEASLESGKTGKCVEMR